MKKKKIVTINIEYERLSHYSDGSESIKKWAEDDIDWEISKDGEPTLDNLLIKIYNNPKQLSLSEDDAIDYSRFKYLTETEFNITAVNILVEILDKEGYVDDSEEFGYGKDKINESVTKLLDENKISL